MEGGALALGCNWIDTAIRSQLFARSSDFLHAPITEDLIMTMLTYRLGLVARVSSLFWIEPSGLRLPAKEAAVA